MTTAKRTDPGLWEKVKDEVTRSGKGGDAGEWSARKAQLAVQEYKRRGGGYAGPKSRDNDLKAWTDEEWGTKSGARSKDTGERYLPKKAREALSDEEYARTTRKKRSDTRKGRQFSSQPEDVADKTAPYRKGGADGTAPTRAALTDAARTLDVEGRSSMDRDALRSAVAAAVKDADVSKADLMTLARTLDVAGRTRMTKSDLRAAIAGAAR